MQVCTGYGPGIDAVTTGTVIGVCIDAEARLRLHINGVECGVAATDIPANPYIVLDLFGSVTELGIVSADDSTRGSCAGGVEQLLIKKKTQHNSNQQQQQRHQHNTQQQLQQQQQAAAAASLLQQQQQKTLSTATPPTLSPTEVFVLSSHDEANLAISRSMNSNADQNISVLSLSNNSVSNIDNATINNVTVVGDNSANNSALPVTTCSNISDSNINSIIGNDSNKSVDSNQATAATAIATVADNITSSNLLNDSNNDISGQHNNALATVATTNTTDHVIPSTDATSIAQNDKEKTTTTTTTTPEDKSRATTELQQQLQQPDQQPVKKCDYQKLCSRFLSSLSLPDAYFCSTIICYCEECHKGRGEDDVYTKGNGIEYRRPLGWCQYQLVSGPSDASWHMAYCSSKPGHVRRMLDKGELLFPGELCMGFPRGGRRSKEEESDGSLLSFSPSVNVAAATALPTRAQGGGEGAGSNNKVFSGRVLLQLAVKPGAYKKVECSADDVSLVTPAEEPTHTAIQWVTKERGATQLLALMVAVDHNEK